MSIFSSKKITIIVLLSIIVSYIIISYNLNVYKNNYITENTIYADNIHNQITSLFQPIYIGANILSQDRYIIELLNDSKDINNIYEYLSSKATQLGCEGIDFVDSKTLVCYQTGGSKVIIDKNNDRDAWYYKLLDSDNKYTTEMFYDSSRGELYLYYNIKILDENSSVLGVLGFLITYDSVSQILGKYADENIIGYIINNKGQIFMHPDQTKIGDIDIYDYYGLLQKSKNHNENIGLQNSTYKKVYSLDKFDGFLIITTLN